MWVTKLMISQVKKRIFCPKTTQFGPKLAFLSIAGSFGALLVGWLVVVARGLYLARHLFTLYSLGEEYVCRISGKNSIVHIVTAQSDEKTTQGRPAYQRDHGE